MRHTAKTRRQFRRAYRPWHINSRSTLISRPVLVSSGHQRQWKELNNALVSAITDIVERWWTDSVSRFPERMPLKPAEEDLLRVCYVPSPTVHPAAGSGTFSQRVIPDPIEEFPRHRDCSYEEAAPRYFALQVLREDRCRGVVLSGMDDGKLSSPAVHWDARPSRTSPNASSIVQ